MPTSRAAAPTAKSIRVIHAAMVTGVILFALVMHFVVRPGMVDSGDFPAVALPGLLSLSLAGCGLSLLLRRRVPQRGSDESADLFWTKAATPALLTWAPLDAACLVAVLTYALTGSQSAIAVAAVAVLLFAALNPAYLERR
jgi:hypothetical protein